MPGSGSQSLARPAQIPNFVRNAFVGRSNLDSDPSSDTVAVEQLEEGDSVVLVAEDVLAVVSAVEDMEGGLVGPLQLSGLAWHRRPRGLPFGRGSYRTG